MIADQTAVANGHDEENAGRLPPGRTRSDRANFIAALPAVLTCEEMAEECAKSGYEISPHAVYLTRVRLGLGWRRVPQGERNVKRAETRRTGIPSKWKRKVASKGATTTAREAMAIVEAARGNDATNALAQLRKLALRVGTLQLRELLTELEKESEF